jgi:hypothetical protein
MVAALGLGPWRRRDDRWSGGACLGWRRLCWTVSCAEQAMGGLGRRRLSLPCWWRWWHGGGVGLLLLFDGGSTMGIRRGGTGSRAVRLQVDGGGHNTATQRWGYSGWSGHLVWSGPHAPATMSGRKPPLVVEKEPRLLVIAWSEANQAYNLDWHADRFRMCLHLYWTLATR